MDTAFLYGSMTPDGGVLAGLLAFMGALAVGLAVGVAICLARFRTPSDDTQGDRGVRDPSIGDAAGTPLLPRG